MAVVASRPSVTTTATLIAQNTSADPGENDYRTWRYLIKNVTGSAAVYIGPSGVTSANGFMWDYADGSLAVELEPGESLYGIVGAGGATQVLHVLKAGR